MTSRDQTSNRNRNKIVGPVIRESDLRKVNDALAKLYERDDLRGDWDGLYRAADRAIAIGGAAGNTKLCNQIATFMVDNDEPFVIKPTD